MATLDSIGRAAEVARRNREAPGTSELARQLAYLLQQGGNAFFRPEQFDPGPTTLATLGMAGAPAVGPAATVRTLGSGLIRRAVPIRGLPQEPLMVGGAPFIPAPSPAVRKAAETYMGTTGRPYVPVENYVPVDVSRARAIAKAYEEMPHTPADPATMRSYEALARETRDQYEALKKLGVKFEPYPTGVDPYAATPRLAAKDFLENKHLYYFPTEQGFGSAASGAIKDTPMLRPSGVKIAGKEVPFNDLFRVVHDVFGHFKEGVGFRAAGEENAWRSHARMYSPEALPAMTAETRGQNSWVNFGPFAEANKGASAAETVYAPQKSGMLPDWVIQSGRLTPLGITAALALEEARGNAR